MLVGVEGHDAVDARLELHARGEAQAVADMHEGAPGLGRDETHFARTAGAWWADLETPLFGEEEREGGDVGVLLVADFAVAGYGGGEVVHH